MENSHIASPPFLRASAMFFIAWKRINQVLEHFETQYEIGLTVVFLRFI
jgi:hypothetical protein